MTTPFFIKKSGESFMNLGLPFNMKVLSELLGFEGESEEVDKQFIERFVSLISQYGDETHPIQFADLNNEFPKIDNIDKFIYVMGIIVDVRNYCLDHTDFDLRVSLESSL